MALKQTTEREKSLRDFTATLDFSLEEVLDDLGKLLVTTGAENPASADSLGILPNELLALLHRLLADLIKKENIAVAGELAMQAHGRTFRRAFKDTRQVLMRTRDMLKNVYEPQDADMLLLGVPRQIPRDMVAGLLRMCRNTLWQLRNPEVEVEMRPELKPNYPEGRETFVNYLKDPVDNLRQLYRQYDRAQGKVKGLQVQRRQALEEYNRCFLEVATIFESLYRLSGRTKIAKDLKPSAQEKGLLLNLMKLRRAIRKGMKEGKEKRQQMAPEAEAAMKSLEDSSTT